MGVSYDYANTKKSVNKDRRGGYHDLLILGEDNVNIELRQLGVLLQVVTFMTEARTKQGRPTPPHESINIIY